MSVAVTRKTSRRVLATKIDAGPETAAIRGLEPRAQDALRVVPARAMKQLHCAALRGQTALLCDGKGIQRVVLCVGCVYKSKYVLCVCVGGCGSQLYAAPLNMCFLSNCTKYTVPLNVFFICIWRTNTTIILFFSRKGLDFQH